MVQCVNYISIKLSPPKQDCADFGGWLGVYTLEPRADVWDVNFAISF